LKNCVFNIEKVVSLVGFTGNIITVIGVKNGSNLCRPTLVYDCDIDFQSSLIIQDSISEIKLINSIASEFLYIKLAVFSGHMPG